jgi:hypothetical protein
MMNGLDGLFKFLRSEGKGERCRIQINTVDVTCGRLMPGEVCGTCVVQIALASTHTVRPYSIPVPLIWILLSNLYRNRDRLILQYRTTTTGKGRMARSLIHRPITVSILINSNKVIETLLPPFSTVCTICFFNHPATQPLPHPQHHSTLGPILNPVRPFRPRAAY